MLASIPDGDTDSVFVYSAVRYQSGKQFWAILAKPDTVQGRSFQVHSERIGVHGIRAVLDGSGKTITGQEDFFGAFQLSYTGSGKAAVINSIKRAKTVGLNLGPGGTASIDEVKLFVDFTKWPES